MPAGPDKVVINSNGLNGRVAAINAEFDSLKHLGNEIIEAGWTKETLQDRDELKKACIQIDQALDNYLDYLRKLVSRWADFIDNHP